MAIRATLECGHSSVLRSRSTPEGYTHDWEVFVRGVNNADIQQYIEKVVFHLHETFPKPKRVLKEPPYVVKESGYAGFVIPIHIYLRNKDEPKKFLINYDLQLQQSGPAISTVIRHNEVFVNPSDDFKKKLLKGGATPVLNSEGTSEKNEAKATPPMVSKPKLSGTEGKKHRLSEPKASNTFAALFGPPIKQSATKVSPDNKKTSSDKTANSKVPSTTEKGDKVDKSAKAKHSPHKDTKKEKSVDERKEKKDKDKESSKEKEKSKEKSKRPLSPSNKNMSPKNKRTASPVPVKKPPSPTPVKRAPSPKPKEKDASKKTVPEKEKEKTKDTSKVSSEEQKSDRKKDKKKHKEDRDKEKKDKHKEKERDKSKESIKSAEKKVEKTEKPSKEKSQEPKPLKEEKKSPKPVKEPEKTKEEKFAKPEKPEKTEKTKESKNDKEKSKHKHKKKDKKEKRDGSKEREKKEKRDKTKSISEKQDTNPPASNPLSTLLAEMPDRDSSDSTHSVDEDALPANNVKKEPTRPSPVVEMARPMSPPPPPTEIKKEKSERHNKRDRSKISRGEERENRKRKRKSDEENAVKREKMERDHSSSPLVEPVSSSQSPIAIELNSAHQKEERDLEEQSKKGSEGEVEQVAPDSTNSTLVDAESLEPPVFSEDYVSQLKDLQQKIMTLQDNQELQRVVQVIAETGQYEITKKTFDFDLCALDRRTVQRLQQFFSAS